MYVREKHKFNVGFNGEANRNKKLSRTLKLTRGRRE